MIHNLVASSCLIHCSTMKCCEWLSINGSAFHYDLYSYRTFVFHVIESTLTGPFFSSTPANYGMLDWTCNEVI